MEITGGWCVAKKKHTYLHLYRGHHLPWRKKKEKKKGKKRGAEYRTRELWLDSLMVLPPTLHRHELAKSIHATFLYPTARLLPLFDAVASSAKRTSKARSCSPTTTWILGAYPFSSRCTTKTIAKKSPTGSLPPAVPLAITRTFRPWKHTSDDSWSISCRCSDSYCIFNIASVIRLHRTMHFGQKSQNNQDVMGNSRVGGLRQQRENTSHTRSREEALTRCERVGMMLGYTWHIQQ